MEFLLQDCLDGEPLVQLNGIVEPAECLPNDSGTAYCPSFPYGIWTSENLTDESLDAIGEWLGSLVLGFPASPLVSPVSSWAKTIRAICGPQQSSASALYDRATSSWRTCQLSFLADTSELFSETWPKAGMTRGGEYFPQPKWARRISAIGSGLWPTPAAQEPGWTIGGRVEVVDKDGDPPTHPNQRWYDKKTGRIVQKGVTQVAQMWHSPTAYDAHDVKRTPAGWAKRAAFRQSIGRDHIAPAGLSEQVWLEQNDIPLKISQWPTPSANKTTRSGEIVNADGTPWDGVQKPHSATTRKPIQTALADAVAARKWPTPTTRDWRSGKASQATMERNARPLSEVVGGQLNPDWVEWLMNWPIGWTSLEPLPIDALSGYGVLDWWTVEPDIPRIVTGVRERIRRKELASRLKALGNGQVPVCAALAFLILSKGVP